MDSCLSIGHVDQPHIVYPAVLQSLISCLQAERLIGHVDSYVINCFSSVSSHHVRTCDTVTLCNQFNLGKVSNKGCLTQCVINELSLVQRLNYVDLDRLEKCKVSPCFCWAFIIDFYNSEKRWHIWV